MGVHARARALGEGFGHERRLDALERRHLTDDDTEGHDVVGHRQRVGIAQVDLVLAGGPLVVTELHRDAHLLQHGDRVTPEIRACPQGRVIEVTTVVQRLGRIAGVVWPLQQVELDLRVRVEGKAHVGSLVHGAFEHVARICPARGAVRVGDVTEHPCRTGALSPRQHLEGRRIWVRHHVGLVHPGVSLDGGAVEAHSLGKCALDLGRSDGHGLQGAEHVGEPQPHEMDVAFLDRTQHELSLPGHVPIVTAPCFSCVACPSSADEAGSAPNSGATLLTPPVVTPHAEESPMRHIVHRAPLSIICRLP